MKITIFAVAIIFGTAPASAGTITSVGEPGLRSRDRRAAVEARTVGLALVWRGGPDHGTGPFDNRSGGLHDLDTEPHHFQRTCVWRAKT
jgi:hypothetical protein